MMRRTQATKVPHSHWNSSEAISALTDKVVGLSRGKEKSWMMRHSPGVDFGMTSLEDEQNGPIRAAKQLEWNGPEYHPADSSVVI